ncbi:MAG: hypothetical protein ACLTSG_04630 [Lachnospiraceae bacterium]
MKTLREEEGPRSTDTGPFTPDREATILSTPWADEDEALSS